MMHSILILFVATFTQAPSPETQKLDREKLESWLAESKDEEISEQFRDHPDQVLPFFDHYLEGGLTMIEKGEPVAQAEESFKKGEQFGAIASTTFGDKIFQEYATAFANWNAKQQKDFRRGQKLFRKGRELMKEDKHIQALEAFMRSYDLAKPLSDGWGMAMAQSGIASAKKELKEWQMAGMHAREAFALNARLRLHGSAIKSFEIWINICRSAQLENKQGILRPVVLEKPGVPKTNEAVGLALGYSEYDLKDYKLARKIREAWSKFTTMHPATKPAPSMSDDNAQ